MGNYQALLKACGGQEVFQCLAIQRNASEEASLVELESLSTFLWSTILGCIVVLGLIEFEVFNFPHSISLLSKSTSQFISYLWLFFSFLLPFLFHIFLFFTSLMVHLFLTMIDFYNHENKRIWNIIEVLLLGRGSNCCVLSNYCWHSGATGIRSSFERHWWFGLDHPQPHADSGT